MSDLLSYQETERLLESIILNKKLFQAKSLNGPKFVVFSHPTGDEFLRSRCQREIAVIEATDMGLPTIENLEKLLVERHLKDANAAKNAEELQEKITAQRRVLQLTKIEGRRKPILETIGELESQINKIKRKDDALFNISAERKADEESVLFLAWVSTYNTDGEKYWSTFEDFEKETDMLFRNSVLDGFIPFNSGVSVKEIRFLARHNLWRIRYSSALKLGGRLFVRDLHDITPDQLGLLYWSNYYQSIYEMMPDEQPDQDIIENDEELDSYMESYFKRKDQERNEGRVKRRGGSRNRNKLSAWDRGEEVIVTAAHPEYMNMAYSEHRVKSAEGASDVEVIAPNSRRARNRAKARQNRK